MSIYFTQERVQLLVEAHEAGKDVITLFLSKLDKELKIKRAEFLKDKDNPLAASGAPYVGDGIDYSTWRFIDHETFMVGSMWDEDGIELPIGVLTGDITPADHANFLWGEWIDSRAQQEEAYRQRKIRDLHKLMSEFPEEVSNHVNQ